MTHEHEKDGLDALFSEAKGVGPGPDLMARVLADAAAVQAEVPLVATAPRGSWLAGLLGAIGGWSAVSGITAAGVMGLAVGLYSPDTVAGLLEGDTVSLGISAYDFTPDVGDLWTEDGDV
ncbi:hypothetical protein A8B78_21460 [Jannaschia sp. EhC01]|nr:hypothetical protein A8B78_21460 [Jannaschia sp. EhC01]